MKKNSVRKVLYSPGFGAGSMTGPNPSEMDVPEALRALVKWTYRGTDDSTAIIGGVRWWCTNSPAHDRVIWLAYLCRLQIYVLMHRCAGGRDSSSYYFSRQVQDPADLVSVLVEHELTGKIGEEAEDFLEWVEKVNEQSMRK